MKYEGVVEYLRCPRCAKFGAGYGFADKYFNGGGKLWGLCIQHRVRWCVTLKMFGVPTEHDVPGSQFDLHEVEVLGQEPDQPIPVDWNHIRYRAYLMGSGLLFAAATRASRANAGSDLVPVLVMIEAR